MQSLPPFVLFGLGLLLVLVIIGAFPRAGMALLGVIVLGMLIGFSNKQTP